MEYYDGYNAVYNLVDPDLWYIGTYTDADYHSCAELCLLQDNCDAFAFHYSVFSTPSQYASTCYGRGAYSHHG